MGAASQAFSDIRSDMAGLYSGAVLGHVGRYLASVSDEDDDLLYVRGHGYLAGYAMAVDGEIDGSRTDAADVAPELRDAVRDMGGAGSSVVANASDLLSGIMGAMVIEGADDEEELRGRIAYSVSCGVLAGMSDGLGALSDGTARREMTAAPAVDIERIANEIAPTVCTEYESLGFGIHEIARRLPKKSRKKARRRMTEALQRAYVESAVLCGTVWSASMSGVYASQDAVMETMCSHADGFLAGIRDALYGADAPEAEPMADYLDLSDVEHDLAGWCAGHGRTHEALNAAVMETRAHYDDERDDLDAPVARDRHWIVYATSYAEGWDAASGLGFSFGRRLYERHEATREERWRKDMARALVAHGYNKKAVRQMTTQEMEDAYTSVSQSSIRIELDGDGNIHIVGE